LRGGLFCLRRRESQCVAQVGFELPHSSNPPISPSQVLGLQVCAITPSSVLFIFAFFFSKWDLTILFRLVSDFEFVVLLPQPLKWYLLVEYKKNYNERKKILVVPEFELRVSHLLGRYSTT
jgi:hypothetical protein